MKKVIVPEQKEEANYFSDFTGQPFGDLYHPPVTLRLEFNYDSKYDGSEITLHLSDKDVAPILDLISSKLNPDFKKSLEVELEENDEQYFNDRVRLPYHQCRSTPLRDEVDGTGIEPLCQVGKVHDVCHIHEYGQHRKNRQQGTPEFFAEGRPEWIEQGYKTEQ